MRVNVENVSKRYGKVEALRSVSFELGNGVTGLLGPNGAGKTTMLRTLATLLEPDDGTVTMNGWNVSRLSDRREIRSHLGYLPQDLGLYAGFTVFEFVDYLAMLKGISDGADRAARVTAALSAVGMLDLCDRRIKTLSGGMRARTGIAQAVVADPQLMLLDEPTTGLDPEERMRFRSLVASLGSERAILLSTHLVEDVAAVCSSVVVLEQGRVLFQGTPAELREKADGSVWSAKDHAPGLMSWRTEDGSYRIIGPKPPGRPRRVAPTVEDGYLLLVNGGGDAR